jgi:hypothetical protein
MPKVRLVTPTRRNTSSIAAFEDEFLNHFGWGEDIDFDVHAANDDLSKLSTLVTDAVKAPVPNVIVSAGLMATNLLQAATSASLIPVIQAAGGGPSTTAQSNITGFTLNSLATANNLLTKFASGRTVTVLYNDYNTTSSYVYSHLAPPPGVTLTGLPIHDPALLVRPAGAIDGFIVIPDAMLYKYHRKVVAMVERKAAQTCYPERQFKNAHEDKGNVKVYGSHVPATFRLAASYVNFILNGGTVAQIVAQNGGVRFPNAVADNDPP